MTEDPQRRYVRVELSIDFEYTIEGNEFQARLTDISEGGAFVDTTYPQVVGSEIAFRFQLPDRSEEFTGRARVIWQQPMLGMGIRFLDLTQEQVDRLKFYVGSVYFHFSDSPDDDDSA